MAADLSAVLRHIMYGGPAAYIFAQCIAARQHIAAFSRIGEHTMVIGKVVGSIVSTRKCENLIGNKFMIIEPVEEMAAGAPRFVAIDNIGAGIGETVLVATGSAARVGMENAPVDAAIVGIVDE